MAGKTPKLGRFRPLAGGQLAGMNHVRRLPPDLRIAEIAYRTVRDRWSFELSRKKQLDAEFEDIRLDVNADWQRIKDVRDKIAATNGHLSQLRRLAQDAGDMAWSVAFYNVAEMCLSQEVRRALTDETNRIMGRHRREIVNRAYETEQPVTPVGKLIRELEKVLRENGAQDLPEPLGDAA